MNKILAQINLDKAAAKKPDFTAQTNQNINKHISSPLIYKPFTEPTIELSEIYIENAGLILYWVYLKKLFSLLGFLNQKQTAFSNKQAAKQAVFLLNFLVYEEPEQLSEDYFTLNKLLCGLETDTVLAISEKITPSQQKALEQLTINLISYWPALGKIKPSSFCQAFIKRFGVLKILNHQWLLRIEKKPQDILLDRLAWSINVVKLPWMASHIVVEW
jgi:hypothetical protein